MSYNGAGVYSLPAGQPVVTGTTISSTTFNTLTSDIATAFNTAFCRDGQAAASGNFNLGSNRITSLGAGVAVSDAVRVDQVQNSAFDWLTAVAGTNTVTGSITPTPAAYAAGQRFAFIPANTNTGATTLNVSSLGAKNIFWNNAACVGGEIRQNIPCGVYYDGTQFHIIDNGFAAPFLDSYPIVEGSADATKRFRIEVDGFTTATTRVLTPPDADLTLPAVTAKGDTLAASASGVLAKLAVGADGTVLTADSGQSSGVKWGTVTTGPTAGTPTATTSGTTVDYTSLPSTLKRITVMFKGVSTNGTSNLLVQIGDGSGGLKTSGYSGSGYGGGSGTTTSTAGFLVTQSINASDAQHGSLTLTRESASGFTWTASGVLAGVGGTQVNTTCGGSVSLTAALDRVRITTVNGTDAFDAGEVNILYE